MSDPAQDTQVLLRLRQLLAQGTLASDVQRNGERLLQRFGSAIRVVLLGPEGEGKDALHAALMAHPVADTKITTVRFAHERPFEGADIGLWATSGFTDAELKTWHAAPDRLKDHSFLVPVAVTGGAGPSFGERDLDVMGQIADEEFHSMFPVLVEPACAVPVSDRAIEASAGLATLIAEIARLVQSGRVADRDNAVFFLKTHEMAQDLEPPSDLEGAPMDGVALASRDMAEAPGGTAQINGVYQAALAHICERTGQFSDKGLAADEAGIEAVLSVCQETSEAVADMISELSAPDPDFAMLKDELLGAADKILLMSVERGVAAATAAVTVLLQVRRDLEARFYLISTNTRRE